MDLLKDFLKEGFDAKALEKVVSDNFIPLKGLTPEIVGKAMESITEFKSYRDNFVNKAISTYKEKTVPGLIEEAVKASSPKEKTDMEKRLEALEKSNAEKDKKLKAKEGADKLAALLGEKKLSNAKLNGLLEFLIADDDTSTLSRGNTLIEGIQELIKAARDEVLKEAGYAPGGGEDNPKTKDLKKQYGEAMKKGDLFTATALEAKIKELK